MKILITGGNGFIGKALSTKLHSLGYTVTAIDKSTNKNKLPYRYISCDLTNNDSTLEKEIGECDIIFHLASPVGIDRIDNESDTFLNDMLKINLNVFNLVKKYDKKIYFSSTSEVYHNTNLANERDNLTIGCPDKSRWGYASGKLTSEFLCKSLCTNSTILRFFNVTGFGDNKGVLFKMVNAIKNNKDISIYGTGDQCRTFCDIKDAVNFMLELITRDVYIGDIFNIGNECNMITIKDLADICIDTTKSDVNILYKKYNEVFSDNYGDIINRKPDCTKMNTIYTSKYNITDIIGSLL
tara:strand:+ start:596 stop:1486 length:891 start_codon:yes stop_codon:yes gene_type:complete